MARSTGSAALATASLGIGPFPWQAWPAAVRSAAAASSAGAGLLSFSSARDTVSPYASTRSATTPSGAMLTASAVPASRVRAK